MRAEPKESHKSIPNGTGINSPAKTVGHAPEKGQKARRRPGSPMKVRKPEESQKVKKTAMNST